jgi:hypothetical protein
MRPTRLQRHCHSDGDHLYHSTAAAAAARHTGATIAWDYVTYADPEGRTDAPLAAVGQRRDVAAGLARTADCLGIAAAVAAAVDTQVAPHKQRSVAADDPSQFPPLLAEMSWRHCCYNRWDRKLRNGDPCLPPFLYSHGRWRLPG